MEMSNQRLFLGIIGTLLVVFIYPATTAEDVENVHDDKGTASNSLDLRSIAIEKAKDETEKFLQTRKQAYTSGRKRKYDRFVYINTGWGKSGSKVSSKIIEVIDGFLNDNGYSFKWISAGEAKVDLFYSKL